MPAWRRGLSFTYRRALPQSLGLWSLAMVRKGRIAGLVLLQAALP